MPPRGPIFIIGAMGSGTTLLRLMLDSHENIAIPHETGFMRSYRAMEFIPFKWTGWNWTKRLGWTPEERDRELAALYDRFFSRYAEQHGAQRWGEKTPLHTWHVGAMKRLFPDAVFVAMVRHPGASTASNVRRFKQEVRWSATHYDRYSREVARVAAKYPRRFVVLRYEDLLLRTEPALRELLDWLGEPWSDRVLEHHVVQGEREHDRIEGGSRADAPVDASRIDAWAASTDAFAKGVARSRLSGIGEFWGYSMDDPAALAPLNDRGAALTTGAEVRARIERFPQLDLTTRPPVPIFEQHYSPRKVWLVRNETGEPHQPPVSRLRRAADAVARRVKR